MNFNHYNTIKKQKSLKSPSKRFLTFGRVMLIRLALVAVALIIVVGSIAAYGAFEGILSVAPSIDEVKAAPQAHASVIYDIRGNEIKQLAGQGTNSIYLPIDEIPEDIRNCFVAMEDERFYEHNGIDIRGIFRAAFSVIKDRDLKYGASTITQQLLKNTVFGGGDEQNRIDKIKRKVQEQYLAVQLEDKLSKEEILEYYLNGLNLGNGATGIGEAAEKYFGKTVSELTISEAAVIAPIAYSPTFLNPLRNESCEEDNRKRREACLNNMLNAGFCSQEQFDEAIADTEETYARLHAQAEVRSAIEDSANSYFVDALFEQLLADLIAHGKSSVEANRLLYTGGLTIYSTQDPEIQEVMDRYFTDESNFPELIGGKTTTFGGKPGSYYELTHDYAMSIVAKDGSVSKHFHRDDFLNYFRNFKDSQKIYYHETGSGTSGISQYTVDVQDLNDKLEEFRAACLAEIKLDYPNTEFTVVENRPIILEPQCAMVIMNPKNGDVVALYGGRGPKEGQRTTNRATQGHLQAGSTFKVLASFLPAIDACDCTLATVFDDSYYQYKGSDKAVINWYSTGFEGLSSIRKGIYHSMNIVAVRCLDYVTPKISIEYLKKLGFKNIVTEGPANDVNSALALGGLTNGCSVLEMTAAYSAIANKGVYNVPRLYTKVYDYDGNLLLNNEVSSTQVMKSSTAYLLTNAMVDTTKKGTGTASAFSKLKVDVAGKTGTAHDNVALWFAGFTPYYCAAIWSGFDYEFEQKNTTYYRYMWRNIMEEVHIIKDYTTGTFERPSSIVSATICSKCGKLAVPDLCDKDPEGSCVVTEYFAKGTVPYETCTCHVKVSVCPDSGMPACDNCPNAIEKVYRTKIETPYALEHGGTKDTKYIIPENLRTCYEGNMVCNLHSGGAGGNVNPGDDVNPGTTPTE